MRLRITHPAIGTIVHEVGPHGLVLGRGGDSDIEFRWDRRISRRHARVWVEGPRLWVEDLESRNGTWCGDVRVDRIGLLPGASAIIGETILSADDANRPPSDEITSPDLEAEKIFGPREDSGTDDLRTEATPVAHRGRQEPRLATDDRVEVQLHDRQELKEMWLGDISKGGLFVACSSPPAIGHRLEVRFATPDGSLSLAGRVVHIVTGGPRRSGFGMQFERLGTEERTAIDRYLEGNRKPDPIGGSAASVARTFLTDLETGDVYKTLDLAPESAKNKLLGRIAEIRNKLEGATDVSAPHAARIATALTALERLEQVAGDPVRRLFHDFRLGYVRSEERIQAARAGIGPSLEILRRVWHEARPSEADRAAFLTRTAFAYRQRNAIEEAISAGQEALACDPFFDELRPSLDAWRAMKSGPKS